MFSSNKKVNDVRRGIGIAFTAIGAAALLVMVVLAVVLFVLCDDKSYVFLAFIPAVFVVVYGAIGIPFLLYTNKIIENKKRLLENGMVIWCYVESYDRPLFRRYDYRRPWAIICSYYDPATGRHCFRSEEILYDPRKRWMPGSMIPVYVNPYNYGDYYVNVD